ncbi:MAG: DUF1080 domain-containing protein [Armatimonadota bacterium]
MGELRPPVVWLGVFILLVAAPAHLQEADDQGQQQQGWVELFNGQDLEGWTALGKARWTVEDGVLIGQQGEGGAAGDLFTRKLYDDFELHVTFKVVWPANSGIWFRSLPTQGKMGYQMDILSMQEYGCTVGTIYSGGFLYQNRDESTVKLDDWNTTVIRAEGSKLAVTLNGRKLAELEDDTYARGRIGFQVHAGDHYGNMKLMVKEAKLRPLGASTTFTLGQFAGSNDACAYVCHYDFRDEELTTKHLPKKIGCITCHGLSKAHEQDEEHLTAPDQMFEPEDVIPFCDTCHAVREKCPFATPEEFNYGDQTCLDCHGKHTLEL